MKEWMKNLWARRKRGIIGFGIYYGIFAAFSVHSFSKGWHIRVLMFALIAILLMVSIGGEEDYTGRWKIYLRDASMAPDVPTKRDRLTEALPFFTVFFLLLPPVVYIIVDILLGNPLI